MCVVSMIGDEFNERWKQPPYQQIFHNWPEVSRAEFESLKKEVEELKSLLKRAKEYDEKNNEPSCELESKMKILREIAKLVGVNLDEVLKNK